MMRIRGIAVHMLTPPYLNNAPFDGGLREKLYGEYDYAKLFETLEQNCRNHVVYFATDPFDLSYILFRARPDVLVVVGPYTTPLRTNLFQSVCEKLDIPMARRPEVERFYYSVPAVEGIDALETEVIALVKYIIDTDVFEVQQSDMLLLALDDGYKIKDYKDDRLPMAMIEERYKNEDDLLAAVGRGDMKQVTQYMNYFTKFQMEKRHDDNLRNSKNYILVLNTLLRKAVQQAEVHPAHIHDVSTDFALKIEGAYTTEEIDKLVPQMLHKYCLLVSNYSLRTYSPLVRKAVNYINFNYTETLTLSDIADIAGVNFTYLSSQFKKETGTSVVEYINQKRMQKAQTLLLTSKLSINAIAEKCGFGDSTYFTKTFKKKHGQSPREYRKRMQVQ
jgi:Response regulator containing CheY-like receiver domain and AraC-type DNA-binding domain